jgi:hypothetical protein
MLRFLVGIYPYILLVSEGNWSFLMTIAHHPYFLMMMKIMAQHYALTNTIYFHHKITILALKIAGE